VNSQKRQRVVCGMSGGVDSSATAALLLEQGYEVIGITLKLWPQDCVNRAEDKCCGPQAVTDARSVCDKLDIPYYLIDEAAEFQKHVIQYFADEYKAGRTPNPCVMCNIWLKFGKLWSYGKQVGADFVATGHYARVAMASDGTPRVRRGLDQSKDQSYVLFGLKRELLPCVLFPVGGYAKSEIRLIAREHDLPIHDKPDSQEICFVPDDDHVAFVRERRGERETAGAIVDLDGTVLGDHAGFEAFTIGQRRGLGIAVGTPRYVVQIEPATHTVTLGPKASLEKAGLTAARFNWQGPKPSGRVDCMAQIRAQHRAVAATVEALDGDRARVVFGTPQSAIAPGQVVTVYQDDLVYGGGWIEGAIERN
jgi:tRNA-specific 2-thiouridylase